MPHDPGKECKSIEAFYATHYESISKNINKSNKKLKRLEAACLLFNIKLEQIISLVRSKDKAGAEQLVTKNYRQRALFFHPDKNPGHAKQAHDLFKLLKEASELLLKFICGNCTYNNEGNDTSFDNSPFQEYFKHWSQQQSEWLQKAEEEFNLANQKVRDIEQQRLLQRHAAFQMEKEWKDAEERATTPALARSLKGIHESVQAINAGSDSLIAYELAAAQEIALGQKRILDIVQKSHDESQKTMEACRTKLLEAEKSSEKTRKDLDRWMAQKQPTIRDELVQLEKKFQSDSGLSQLETCIHRFFFHFWTYSDELKQNLSQQKQAYKQKVEQLASAQSTPAEILSVYKEFRNSPVIATHRNSWFRAIGRTASQIQFDNKIASISNCNRVRG